MTTWLHETFSQLAMLDPIALGAALACYLVSLAARATAWSNVVALTATTRVARPGVCGAFLAGAGVNAVAPARAGVPVRLVLARPYSGDVGWSGLAGTLAVEGAFNTLLGAALVGFGAVRLAGSGTSLLPSAPTAVAALAAALALALVAAAALRLARAHVLDAWTKARRALALLGRPRTYLSRVVAWQALDWLARLATIALVLRATGVPYGPGTILLTQVALCIAMLLPLTPAGVGAKQGAVVLLLAGVAPATTLVAFGVALGLVHAIADVALGLTALTLMLRTPDARDALGSPSLRGVGRVLVGRAPR